MDSYELDAYGAPVKVRDPVAVTLLHIFTLGFYNLYWYYKLNKELKEYGRVYQDQALAESRPGLSLLAVTLGSLLIVPPWVSWYRATGRIRRAQGIGGAELTSGWVLFALYVGGLFVFLPLIAIPPVVQSGLNGLWSRYRDAPALDQGDGQLGRPEAPAAGSQWAPPEGAAPAHGSPTAPGSTTEPGSLAGSTDSATEPDSATGRTDSPTEHDEPPR